MNSNLRPTDRVLIHETGSPIDGKPGVIIGLAVLDVIPHWIVELDEWTHSQHGFDVKAISIPESCLKRLYKKV